MQPADGLLQATLLYPLLRVRFVVEVYRLSLRQGWGVTHQWAGVPTGECAGVATLKLSVTWFAV